MKTKTKQHLFIAIALIIGGLLIIGVEFLTTEQKETQINSTSNFSFDLNATNLLLKYIQNETPIEEITEINDSSVYLRDIIDSVELNYEVISKPELETKYIGSLENWQDDYDVYIPPEHYRPTPIRGDGGGDRIGGGSAR